MTRKGRWSLDPREVVSGYDAVAQPATCLSELPKDSDVREYTVWLEHRPTGLRAQGNVPHGRYTHQQLELLEIELRKSLFAELELKVGRRLGKTDA